MLTEKQSVADGFCQFFSSAANRLKRTTFPLTEITWSAKPTKVTFIRQQFSFKTVSDEEVSKHLKQLNRKSANTTLIPERYRLRYLKTTSTYYKLFFNKWSCTTRFQKSKSNFDNYRPISVLSAISKILEKCVHSQLIEHLEKNNLLSQNQFGFCKYRSTELAAVWFTDQIRRSMDAVCLQAPFV